MATAKKTGKAAAKKTAGKKTGKATAKKKTLTPARPSKAARAAAEPKGRKVSFKKEITQKLQEVKNRILQEVAQKVRSESNHLKHEIGDIYDIASNAESFQQSWDQALSPTAAEALLVGNRATTALIDEVADRAGDPAKPLDNADLAHHWRKRMSRVFVRRALTDLVGLVEG